MYLDIVTGQHGSGSIEIDEFFFSEINIQTEHNICKKSQLVGGKPVGFLQSVALDLKMFSLGILTKILKTYQGQNKDRDLVQ